MTDIPDTELAGLAHDLESHTVNPMNVKKRLAREITGQFHEQHEADTAQANFERVVQGHDLPDDIPEVAVSQLSVAGDEQPRWSRWLVDLSLAASTSEAKRLINQKAVEIIPASGGPFTLTSDTVVTDAVPICVIKVGKRRFVRLVEG